MTVRTPPKASPVAVWVAIIIALLLIALAVVAVRDLATTQGWIRGTAWSTSLVKPLDGLTASTAVVIVAVLIGLVGLWVVWLSLKPARRTHVRANVDEDVWFTRAAVAALAQNVADRTPGVISADATRRGRTITIDVATGQNRHDVESRVHDALAQQIDGLTNSRFTLRTKEVPR